MSEKAVFKGKAQYSAEAGLQLTVPASIVLGSFKALVSPGVELPRLGKRVQAGVTIVTPAEVQKIGGPEKLVERGRTYSYRLSSLRESPITGDATYGRRWYFEVESPELRDLRRSYGLASEPVGGFTLEVGRRRKNVLRENVVSKQAIGPVSSLVLQCDCLHED